MSKFSKIAATLAVIPMLAFAAPVYAGTSVTVGQIEQGDIYRVEDVTTNNGTFADSITPACGDTVGFRVRIHNVGPDTLTNVKVAAILDNASSTSHASEVSLTADNALNGATVTATSGLTTSQASTVSYVSGSTELLDANGNQLSTLPDGIISTSGINIGSVGPLTSDSEEVQFEAKVNCPTPVVPTPVYTCNLLSLTEPAGTTKEIQANVEYTATNGATFTNVTYNFGDGVIVPSATGSATINHTYANYGTYTVTATANFEVNGSSQSATSAACAQTVTFTAPATPAAPTTPAATPTQLVNTGPGDVVALFGGVTVLGAVAHRLFGRRLVSLFVR